MLFSDSERLSKLTSKELRDDLIKEVSRAAKGWVMKLNRLNKIPEMIDSVANYWEWKCRNGRDKESVNVLLRVLTGKDLKQFITKK